MRSEDFDAFAAVIGDLCAAYDRPATDERKRVFWEDLKHLHLHDVKRSAQVWRKSKSKMPTPRDLIPERPTAPPQEKADDGPSMSSWAIAANRILFVVAYQGDRGFTPMGDAIHACLAAKADYVRMAEEAEAGGERWDTREFNAMCREGFQRLLRQEQAA